MKVYKLALALTTVAAMTACVPARQFEELEAKHKQCEEDMKKFKDAAEASETKLKELQAEFDQVNKDYVRTKNDLTLMEGSYNTLQTQYDHMERLNKEIMDKLKFLQGQAEDESAAKSAELEKKELELLRKEDELRKLAASLEELKKELEQKKADLADKEKRIDELEELIRQKDAIVNALKEKVSNALLSFKDKGLTVEEKNGKVYVSMEAKLLFASGSTKVEAEGKDALVKLAKVLEGQSDMEVVVEGHTDTDKLNSNNYPHNNWELSVLRSTAVVQIMLGNSSMDPKILSASGRSEFHPVDPSDKAKNRRIEVILTPNLDELYDIIGK